jgi:hypothetical protein
MHSQRRSEHGIVNSHPLAIGGGRKLRLRSIAFLGALFAAVIVGVTPVCVFAAQSVRPAKPVISPEASAALLRMGHTLSARAFSFQAQTIRVYSDQGGDYLHIFHRLKVVVDRPNRMMADTEGDDGSTRIVFDGKTAYVYSPQQNKYAAIPVPGGTIEDMLKEAIGRLGVDFPLADFLSAAPNKAFLTGVTAGRVVNTVTIAGSPYLHLFFNQPPGIELELWLSNNEQSLPTRLIVTYLNLPGQPNFIAQFSDWHFDIHPAAADFAFQPPAGAQKIALKPVEVLPAPKQSKGAK